MSARPSIPALSLVSSNLLQDSVDIHRVQSDHGVYMLAEIFMRDDMLETWKHGHVPSHNFSVPFAFVKSLVWFWLIDETLSANLVYQSNYEIGSTTPSDEAMAKIMTMVMAW